uniref:Interferon induced transmembrane protein 3 n=1 Tax=Neolamprologus brichardi TaxID=32507 RepID=A0A3Q4HJV3_NEOBR
MVESPRYKPTYVPVQVRTYDGPSGQPGGSVLVQHTSVNIVTEPPKDHFIWSLLCFVYSNPCCLGLAALIYSIKARDRKVAGDLEGARRHGFIARGLNISTVVYSAVGCCLFLFFFFFHLNDLGQESLFFLLFNTEDRTL